MFYRRKILLALLGLMKRGTAKARLQTLLLLFSRQQAEPSFDFIPDTTGPVSLTALADLSVMTRKKMVRETETAFSIIDTADYPSQLSDIDRELLRATVAKYGRMERTRLVHEASLLHPYYASRSDPARTVLSAKEYARVRSQLKRSNKTVLFTIGYEGIALEEYLNRLLRNDVKAIVDIRNHPVSMKYGFSRATLRRFCERIGVAYYHLPEVGIKPEDRSELHTQDDYDHLFALYRKRYLPATIDVQRRILELLTLHKRIALACVEAELNRCHRTVLAEALSRMPEFSYEVRHL